MVRVTPTNIINVQSDLRVVNETLKEFANQIHIEVADAAAGVMGMQR